jgi:transketolase
MKNFKKFCNELRIDVLKIISEAGSSHIASCFSVIEIITSIYKLKKKKCDFILSKGHAAAALYSLLHKLGKISTKEKNSFYQNGSKLMGHVSHKLKDIQLSTGSLGHGLGVATGFAYEKKVNNNKNQVFTVMSDGECDEGSVWEAALFASHHKLNNLCVFIDYNKIQSIRSVEKTLNLEPFNLKWKSFGWRVKIINGHSEDDLKKFILDSKISKKPNIAICNTIKGKGVSFMENNPLWHYRCPKNKEYLLALEELR